MTIRFIFFPFTHICENQLKTVLTFFPSFEYLPMTKDFDRRPNLNKLFGQRKILPFFLSYDRFVALEQNLEQYLAWAQIHKGNEVNFKLLLKQTPYFTNDSDVTSIKSKIKRGHEGKDPDIVLPGESQLLQDLLFLKMADLYDAQNEGIDLALNHLDTSHDTLISNLRGLESFSSQNETSKVDNNTDVDSKKDLGYKNGPDHLNKDGKDEGAFMTQQRIWAWSRCMAAMGGLNHSEGETPLFITTSQAVFDYLESNCNDVVNALDIDMIKVHENKCKNKNQWQDQFCDDLMSAVRVDGDRENNLPQINDKCHLSGEIKLSIFSGNDINKLFNCSDKQIYGCLIKLK